MATLKERIDRHDRDIAAIRKLILIGMKMIVKNESEIRKLTAEQRETARMIRETDRELKAFIRSLRRGSNGHARGRADIQ